jgi:hypothetical protein
LAAVLMLWSECMSNVESFAVLMLWSLLKLSTLLMHSTLLPVYGLCAWRLLRVCEVCECRRSTARPTALSSSVC